MLEITLDLKKEITGIIGIPTKGANKWNFWNKISLEGRTGTNQKEIVALFNNYVGIKIITQDSCRLALIKECLNFFTTPDIIR